MHPNKRKLNLLVFLAACVFISIAATKPSATKTIVKSATAKDTGIFKNLKVLPKTISKVLTIILFGGMILIGVVISLFSTHRSVLKYLRMKLDDLY